MSVRVRYAPSPTGLQHIGGVRTALFNYFFARSRGGAFILRIEDTDRERYDPRALQDIYDTFDWLGLVWDEGPRVGGAFGPYFQSERTDLYRQHAERLVAAGRAYPCFCSQERLDKLREEQASKTGPQGYDRHCRSLPVEQAAARRAAGEKCVIRLKIPLEGSTAFVDRLIGRIERANLDVNPDPVLLKSDGYPTYHLANVVDDHFMQITHIMRAQEWIPSGPLHVILYDAFGWTAPEYCHLPMVMGQDGQKLSKRHGSTSLVDFRNQGYLPEAVINYISLLGWAYDDTRQLFGRAELEKLFDLDKLNKAAAVFDYKKLEWFNGVYIRETPDAELAAKIAPFLERDGLIGSPPARAELELVAGAVPIIKERLKFLKDASGLLRFLVRDVDGYDAALLVPKKASKEDTYKILDAVSGLLSDFEKLSDQENEARFRALAESLGVKLNAVLMPLRVALTGSPVSPPLFESMRLLGVKKIQERIAGAKKALAAL